MADLILSRLLSDKPFYSAHFMDLALWEPSVRMVCDRNGFAAQRVSPGLPGTFPTFIVKLEAGGVHPVHKSIVVKFFGLLFEGAQSFAVERAMGRYLTQHTLEMRSPAVLAEGRLTPEWHYLIFEAVSGVSIGQVRQQLSELSWVRVASQMGTFMRGLHTVTVNTKPIMPMATSIMDWDGFVDFLEMQRVSCHSNHLRWNDLPPQLLAQVQDYLLPVQDLLDLASPPHLIHADLTADHLLGRLLTGDQTPSKSTRSPLQPEGDWDGLAIIDWGDTRLGNILYELVALHMDLFQADKHLLSVCLEQYGLPGFYKQDFPRKALCMLLLHQFPMSAQMYALYQDVQTLHELAEGLFGV
jgi:hypothetical protein